MAEQSGLLRTCIPVADFVGVEPLCGVSLEDENATVAGAAGS